MMSGLLIVCTGLHFLSFSSFGFRKKKTLTQTTYTLILVFVVKQFYFQYTHCKSEGSVLLYHSQVLDLNKVSYLRENIIARNTIVSQAGVYTKIPKTMQNLLICVGVLRCSGGHCRKLKALAYTFDDGRVFFCLAACSHWPHTQLHQLYPDISTTSAAAVAAAPPSNAAGPLSKRYFLHSFLYIECTLHNSTRSHGRFSATVNLHNIRSILATNGDCSETKTVN